MVDLSRFGTKHVCMACACKFYDLNRPEAVCPKCGSNQADLKPPKKAVKLAPVRVEVEEPDVDPDIDNDDDDPIDDLDTDDFEGLSVDDDFSDGDVEVDDDD